MKFKHLSFCTVLLICCFLGACRQKYPGRVTFKVKVPPPYHTQNSTLYIAGDFNQWNPKDERFRLQFQKEGFFTATFDSLPKTIQYKYTQGSWNIVERNPQGGEIANRKHNTHLAAETEDVIARWQPAERPSTASRNVQILDTAFTIQPLQRTRRIWVYIPSQYYTDSLYHPVIYMHDGQNLFDSQTSYAGEWGIDEVLDSYAPSQKALPIVVGIDNGGKHRLDEYSPFINLRHGGGEGNQYLTFLVEHLKPHIDTTFRTLTQSANTAIGGSSMGGLISLYAAAKYPNIFGKAFVFSPSLWFSKEIFTVAQQADWHPKPKLYFLVGEQEGGDMVNDLYKMKELLQAKGFDQNHLFSSTIPNAEHNEVLWRAHWRNAYDWLFSSEDLKL